MKFRQIVKISMKVFISVINQTNENQNICISGKIEDYNQEIK